MNILAYVHLPEIHGATGAGRVATQMTQHLAERSDVNLRILGNRSLHDDAVAEADEPWSSYTYALFDRHTTWQKAAWYLLGRPPAEAYWEEADVMYCTEESYVPTQRARLAVTVHDAALFETRGVAHPDNWQKWKQRMRWTLLYRRLAKRADLFHTVSQYSAERIAHHFPQIRSRLRVVHNAVAPHFFTPPPPKGLQYLREHGLADEAFVMLPRGLHYRKNADLVLQSWPRIHEACPDVKLVVTSHNDPEYVRKAKALGDSVVVTGFVSEEALHAIYGAATLTWMPSRYEGFGMPVLESMACGTPVVASNATAIPEVAGEAAFLVDPLSPAAHEDAVISLLRDDDERAKFVRKGKDRAQQFTWKRAAKALRAHFEDIV